MKWLAPMSITTCHRVQSPIFSVCWKMTAMKQSCNANQSSSVTIQSKKLDLNPISLVTEFFHSAA